MEYCRAPEIERDWALFLDLDGTLLDLAPRPDQVIVPGGLCDTLRHLRDALNGALAIVSGRPLSEIDRLLGDLKPTAAGEHGAVIRYPNHEVLDYSAAIKPPAIWIAALHRSVKNWPGVIIEEKCYSIAVHFRLAPERAESVATLMGALVAQDTAHFELLVAHQALEIKPRGVSKADVVRQLMAVTPFKTRFPVFVGDDVTDLDGMAAAQRLGGLGLHVAHDFGNAPSAVREWIAQAAMSFA